QHRPSARSVDLRFEIERRALLAVRATMEHRDHRMLGSFRAARGVSEECLDLVFEIVADEGEGLHFSDRNGLQECGVDVCELRCGFAVEKEQLGLIAWRGKRKGELAVSF